jgi:thioredoxin 1
MAHEHVVELTASNFDEVVMRADKPVLVDLWAPWCGPCRALGPTIDELAAEHGGPDGTAVIAKLNTDEEQNLAASFGIAAIPTILVFRNGEIVERLVGLHGKQRLEDALGVPA